MLLVPPRQVDEALSCLCVCVEVYTGNIPVKL